MLKSSKDALLRPLNVSESGETSACLSDISWEKMDQMESSTKTTDASGLWNALLVANLLRGKTSTHHGKHYLGNSIRKMKRMLGYQCEWINLPICRDEIWKIYRGETGLPPHRLGIEAKYGFEKRPTRLGNKNFGVRCRAFWPFINIFNPFRSAKSDSYTSHENA